MSDCYFITGTDTEIGKTLVAQGLITLANRKGLRTLAIKPIAAGSHKTSDGWRNEDALALQKIISVPLCYEQINPFALPAAVAPHIAADNAGVILSVNQVLQHCQLQRQLNHDFLVVEGAGGWRVPLGPGETLADFAKALDFPVILVVGLRLGCINHALLTAEAIIRDGLTLIGWVANEVNNSMPCVMENVATLVNRLKAPCIGHIPYVNQADACHAARYLDIDKLLE